MASRQLHTLIQHLRRCVCPRGEDTLDDAQLLERWSKQRDEAAFEVLLWRHGAMVLSVCRRLLRDSHDIEDAFQVAFLTLVRKGASIRRPEALAAWLYRVAYRIALRLRGEAAERARREQVGVETLPGTETDEAAARDLCAALDEEIDALPERYRQAFVLCCLEGKTHAEAARLLGRPTGTVSCWLKRGRERLRERLARRGFAPAALVAIGESEARAVLPAALVQSTGRAATVFATGGCVSAGVSARVAVLVEGAIKGMAATKLQWTLLMGLTLGMAAAGAGMWAYQSPTQQSSPKQQTKAETPETSRQQHEPAAQEDRYGDPLPDGTIARLGTVRLRAVGASVALSPDGKTIIAVIGGRQVQSWDAESGKPHARRELPFQLSQFFLSNDGRLLAGQEQGFDSPIIIWDLAANKRRHQLRLPQRTGIYRAQLSPDGKTLAVSVTPGGQKPGVHLWDLASGERRELSGPTREPESLAFSPDGKFLAATDGHSLICWDVARGEKLWHRKCAFGVTLGFMPDGRALISSPGHQERAWHAWNVATGTPTDRLKLPQGYNYAHFAVAPDGRTLVFAQRRNVAGSDGRVRLWDLRTAKMLHTLATEAPALGPFFPDGKSFLTNDGALQRWELATGRPLLPETDTMGHKAEVIRAVYSPDGRWLASSAWDGTIRVWEVATAKPLHVLRAADRYVFGLAFTPEGRFLVSGSQGFLGALFVWDMETGKEVRRILLHDPKRGENQQNVIQLHVTPDGGTVIVLGYNPDGNPGEGILSCWDLATGQRKSRVETGPSDGFSSGFSPDGRTLASRGKLLDTATGKVRVKLEGERGWLPQYVFGSDGRLVAGLVWRTVAEGKRSSTKMDGIQLWDAATGRVLRRLSTTDSVGQLAFSPDGHYLAAAGLQGLWLWELASGKVVLRHKAHERMRGSYGDSFASCLSFAPDGRTLATGHLDSTILLWNLVPSGRPPTVKDLPRRWEELIGTDAARAYTSSWRMADAPKEATRFLRERLRPVSPAAAEQVRPLLADLDSDDFAKREAATDRLRELGDRANRFLKEALKEQPSLEMRRRVEELLKTLEEPPSGETLRTLRAMAVLERIGTPDARQVLNRIAQGIPEARVTREAKAAVERLTARHPSEK
jgi:RNA polymerase sigma factor (sigma-70 family)